MGTPHVALHDGIFRKGLYFIVYNARIDLLEYWAGILNRQNGVQTAMTPSAHI